MTQDAIIGAKYKDSVYDCTFTIVEISAETTGSVANEDEIVVSMDYDILDDPIHVRLDQFRSDDTIEIVEVPDHRK